MYDFPRDDDADDNWDDNDNDDNDNDNDNDNAVHKSLKYVDLKKIMANNMERIPELWICQFAPELFCLY